MDIDDLAHGAFICDARGVVQTMNEPARRLLEGLIGEDRRIRVLQDGNDLAFAELIGAALDPSRDGEDTAMACELPVGRAVVLHAMRLRRDRQCSSQPDVLVILETRPRDPTEALRRKFGLTVTESRVATALAEGIGLAEIGLRLGIARGTVRSHLKSIFRKTETTGQVQLVVLVFKLWRSGAGA